MIWTGLSKVADCRQKSPPTWLVSASYSAGHFFMDGRLLWQLGRVLQNFLTTLILILIRNLGVKNMSEEECQGPILGVCFKRELTVNGHNRLPVHKTLINTTLNIPQTEQYIHTYRQTDRQTLFDKAGWINGSYCWCEPAIYFTLYVITSKNI